MIPRVAILISGRGSNMVALAESVRNGALAGRCEIAVVVASRPGAPGLARAREMSMETLALNARGMGKEVYDDALLAALESLQARLGVPEGYDQLQSADIPVLAAQAALEGNRTYPTPRILLRGTLETLLHSLQTPHAA